jgi:hypothetical protein
MQPSYNPTKLSHEQVLSHQAIASPIFRRFHRFIATPLLFLAFALVINNDYYMFSTIIQLCIIV